MKTAGCSSGSGGHSADVRIRLRVGDASFNVAQIGGGRLIFANPVMLPCGPGGARGEVLLSIDGDERRWAVDLKPQSEPGRVVEATFAKPVDVAIGGSIQG